MIHEKKCTYKTLVRNILGTTVFFPIFILLLTQLYGATPSEAFRNSLEIFYHFPEALHTWVFFIVVNCLVLIYTKPILAFWSDYSHNKPVLMKDRNRVMKRLNMSFWFILIICLLGFSSGIIIEYISSFGEYQGGGFPFIFLILESLSTGFFTAIMVSMNLDIILFPVKKALMLDPPEEPLRYQSFYLILMKSIVALLVFFSFQIFSISSDFFSIGTRMSSDFFTELGKKGATAMIGSHDTLLKGTIYVFYIRLAVFLGLALRILFMIKTSLKKPLDTVHNRLEGLTSGDRESSSRIAIVNNDEFSSIYKEINKLINRQEGELEQAQDLLSQIINHAADPIISFKTDGSIIMFNPAAETYFQWSKEDLQSCSLSQLFSTKNKQEVCPVKSNLVNNLLKDSRNLQRYEGLSKNGEERRFEASFSTTETSEGPIHTAILRDISKQMEMEENLRTAKSGAERANKMKSEFLANMSHELRTPLNAILGFTQIIQNDKNLTDGQKNKIKIISHSGEHLLGLINDILDISKIEAGKLELHSSAFLLKSFTEDIREMFELRCSNKGLVLDVEYLDELPPVVLGDMGKLRQILINLMGNAVKFTDEGGISLVLGWDGEKIRFSISDTGKGIPLEDQERILEPFVQSSNVDNQGGTGLGLAITSSFVEMMGGKLELHSEVGKGSTFSFAINLPLSDENPEEKEVKGQVLGIEGDLHPHALIVDDKVNNRLILKEMLETAGFVTMEAANGLEALQRLDEFKAELVFMDIKMPVMDGYEAVKKIKTIHPVLPVYALTASAFKHDESHIREVGFDGFLAKPFKQASLFGLIEENSNFTFRYEEITTAKASEPLKTALDWNLIVKNASGETLESLDDMMAINDFLSIKKLAQDLLRQPGLEMLSRKISVMADNFDEEGLLSLIEEWKKILQEMV